MQKRLILLLMFNSIICAISQLSKRKGISHQKDEEFVLVSEHPNLRNTGRMNPHHIHRRQNFSSVFSNHTTTSNFVEVPLFERVDVATHLAGSRHQKTKRRRPRPHTQSPLSSVIHHTLTSQLRQEVHPASMSLRHFSLSMPFPRMVQKKIHLGNRRQPPTRNSTMLTFTRPQHTFIHPAMAITTQFPLLSHHNNVFGQRKRKRLRTTTTHTSLSTRPHTDMTHFPTFRHPITVSHPTRTFPTQITTFALATTSEPLSDEEIFEETHATLPHFTIANLVFENSREFNTIDTEPSSTIIETEISTTITSLEPPPTTLSPFSEDFFDTTSKSNNGRAGPPGFVPPNDHVVDALNNAIDFMVIAERLRLRSKRLSFLRRFSAQVRAKAAIK